MSFSPPIGPEIVDGWQEIDEKTYWYFLEVLPPIYFPGGFAVSEPITHNEEGFAVYQCCAAIGGKYYGREATRKAAAASLPALRATLEANRKSDSDDNAYATWRDSQAERGM